jgi:oligopeptide/dipeptide ABC transporter ATP-binding protein
VPTLLDVQNLRLEIGRSPNTATILHGVAFQLDERSRTGIVGESGSGKSLTALTVLGLPPEEARVLSGEIIFRGRDLLQCSPAELVRMRGKEISMVFQNAAASLNPLLPVGRQIADVYRFHERVSKEEASEKAIEMLSRMGIPAARKRARSYPHEFSGGMAQRAMIAMALVCSPRLLIADEPTTGLDLTVQVQVLDLIMESVEQVGSALLFISHDLRVVSEMCDRVIVMYAGTVVEVGPAADVLVGPSHPYTQALLRCVSTKGSARMNFIPGQVPVLNQPHARCPFVDRCAFVFDRCRCDVPQLQQVGDDHWAACHLLGRTP